MCKMKVSPEARLWRRAKVGDNILEFGDFDLESTGKHEQK
jgi:hypothetical protein